MRRRERGKAKGYWGEESKGKGESVGGRGGRGGSRASAKGKGERERENGKEGKTSRTKVKPRGAYVNVDVYLSLFIGVCGWTCDGEYEKRIFVFL